MALELAGCGPVGATYPKAGQMSKMAVGSLGSRLVGLHSRSRGYGPAMQLDLYGAFTKASRVPLGRAVVSLGYRAAAPYFLTAPMRLREVEPGRAVATMRHAPWVRNHLGGVHAIALCNLAEYAMGATAEATIPAATHRWIPRGMTVQYRSRAKGPMTATTTLALPDELGDRQELPVEIAITDAGGGEVCCATITIWVTAKSNAPM
jgi:acyl-coenzyme A thioesterase PaaI-like protein